MVSTIAFSAPIFTVVLLQYARFGTGMFLGWDTSTYVWWARLIEVHGAGEMVRRWNYPNLYVLAVTALGGLLGSDSLAERLLQVLASVPLGYAYFWLGRTMTGDRNYGILAAVLGGLSANTLRLVADLHRNLLAFSFGFPLAARIYARTSAGATERESVTKEAVLLWLPALAMIAYTHLETYALVAFVVLLGHARSRRWRTAAWGLALLAAPVLVASPFLIPFLGSYVSDAGKGLLLPPAAALWETVLFLGGFALPLTVIGLLELRDAVKRGGWVARFLADWMILIVVLIPPAMVIGLQSSRLFVVAPLPLILTLALTRLRPLIRALQARGSPAPTPNGPLPRTRRPSSWRRPAWGATLATLLLVAPVVASAVVTVDSFLTPYVAEPDILRLQRAAALVRANGFRDPIVVYYGSQASDLSSIYRAYFGIDVPDALSYYGKLQFVFTLPPPADVYVWKYNPPAEQTNSVNFRAEIIARVGSAAAVSSKAIVLVKGGTYDGPLSESFLARFETLPGIFVIPPGSLAARDVDDWRLYAFSDGSVSVWAPAVAANWSRAPKVLEWIEPDPIGPFDAVYPFSLTQAWSSMSIVVRLWDWSPMLRRANGSSVLLAPVGIFLDGVPLLVHRYGGLGPLDLTLSVSNVSAGLHRIIIHSFEPGLGGAIRLDEIRVAPQP